MNWNVTGKKCDMNDNRNKGKDESEMKECVINDSDVK